MYIGKYLYTNLHKFIFIQITLFNAGSNQHKSHEFDPTQTNLADFMDHNKFNSFLAKFMMIPNDSMVNSYIILFVFPSPLI